MFPSLFQLRMTVGARVQIASVVLPGTILLLELWFLAGGIEHPLADASRRTDGVSSWVLAFAAVIVVIGAVLVGLAARSVAWPAFTWLERRVHSSSEASPGCSVRAENTDHVCTPVCAAIEQINAAYGAGAVESLVGTESRQAVVFFTRDFDAVREYCKGWLRTHAAPLSVDGHEIEIAFVVAASVPALLFPVTFATYKGWWHLGATQDARRVFEWVVVGIATLLVVPLFFKRAMTRRREEMKDAIRNYCLAHWYQQDLALDVGTDAKPSVALPQETERSAHAVR
jgi:hypothetical protein